MHFGQSTAKIKDICSFSFDSSSARFSCSSLLVILSMSLQAIWQVARLAPTTPAAQAAQCHVRKLLIFVQRAGLVCTLHSATWATTKHCEANWKTSRTIKEITWQQRLPPWHSLFPSSPALQLLHSDIGCSDSAGPAENLAFFLVKSSNCIVWM